VCVWLAAVFWIAEFMMYKEFIDPLYTAKQSVNGVGIIKPAGAVHHFVRPHRLDV
jgi:hypothetical protein